MSGGAILKALTIDAYWAWAIIYGKKRVENRSWRTHYRGLLAIHAGKNCRRDQQAIDAMRLIDPNLESCPTEVQADSIRGRIIGIVDLVGCVEASELDDDPWAFGPFCWLLRDIQPIAVPVPAIGRQGLWAWP